MYSDPLLATGVAYLMIGGFVLPCNIDSTLTGWGYKFKASPFMEMRTRESGGPWSPPNQNLDFCFVKIISPSLPPTSLS